MAGFSIRNPYFIIVICLVLVVIGVTSLARMPVDLFPPINLPEVVVATFYSGMPPEDVETDITDPLERFFTLASGVDHMESRSLLGVSIIKVYFQPGTSPDADVTELSNLALAEIIRQGVAARSRGFIDHHDFRTVDAGHWRRGFRSVAKHKVAHQLAIQFVDDVIRDHAAVIVAFIDDRAVFVLLGVIVASKRRISGARCIRQPHVRQSAARKTID